jgi:hypothetical protein
MFIRSRGEVFTDAVNSSSIFLSIIISFLVDNLFVDSHRRKHPSPIVTLAQNTEPPIPLNHETERKKVRCKEANGTPTLPTEPSSGRPSEHLPQKTNAVVKIIICVD